MIKRILFYIFITLTIGLTASAQMVDLSLNLKQGKTYPLETSTKMTFSYKLGPINIKINTRYLVKSEYTVESIQGDRYTLKGRFDEISLKTWALAVMSKEYSSKKPNSKEPMSQIMAQIQKQTFHLVIDQRGKTIESHFDNPNWNKTSHITPNDEMNKKEIQKKMDTFGKMAMESPISAAYDFIPEKPMKIGKSWSVSIGRTNLMTVEGSSIYRITSANKRRIKINGTGKVTFEEGNMDDEKDPIKIEAKGLSKINIEMDGQSHWINESTTIHDLTGTITMIEEGEKITLPYNSKLTISAED